MNLSDAIFFAGVVHLGVLIAGSLVPRKLNWKEELARLSDLNQQVLWTHGAYVFFTILAIGLTSVLFAGELANGTNFSRYLCGLFSLFWMGRLALGIIWFEVRPHLTTPSLRVGYYVLNLSFVALCGVYGYAALG